jgi:anti-anti-sigma factor
MDSIGLSIVVSVHRRCEESGLNLTLVVPPRLRRLLEIAGLDDVLHLQARPDGMSR